MMLPVPNRTWPLLLAAMTVPLLAACGNDKPTTWQGYVEGEFVAVASPFAGRLDTLSVDRGQQVEIGRAHV